MSEQKSPLDWVATGVGVAGVFTSLFSYDVLQRIAILFGPHAHQRSVTGMARGINRSARMCGTRFRVEGLEHVDFSQNYIIVSNHQSLLDISMTSDFLAPLEPRYISKRELGRRIPGVSFNLTHGGSALIDRKDPAQAHAEIERIAKRVRDDHWTVMIFPEGTRSKTGALRAFRPAGLRTLLLNAPGVPVLPVTTSGGSRLFKYNLTPVVRGIELVYRIHAPVMPPVIDDSGAFEAFVNQLETTIRDGLEPEDRVVAS